MTADLPATIESRALGTLTLGEWRESPAYLDRTGERVLLRSSADLWFCASVTRGPHGTYFPTPESAAAALDAAMEERS